MGLLKGNYQPVEQQAVQNSLSAEDERLRKRSEIVFKLRRWWRIYMIAMYIFSMVACAIEGLWKGIPFVGNMILGTFVFIIFYLLVLYLFLYIAVGRTLQVYFYLKDLLGGNKETRL